MARPSLREKILAEGAGVLLERGYAAATVAEITSAAGAPKGSFSNHFRSKEEFGLLVVERYYAGMQALLEEHLADRTRPPRERLLRYIDTLIAQAEGSHCAKGCLLGNLALEMSAHSEPLRLKIAELLGRFAGAVAACLEEGQRAGVIPSRSPPGPLGGFVVNALQGALLRSKVERDATALHELREIVLNNLLT